MDSDRYAIRKRFRAMPKNKKLSLVQLTVAFVDMQNLHMNHQKLINDRHLSRLRSASYGNDLTKDADLQRLIEETYEKSYIFNDINVLLESINKINNVQSIFRHTYKYKSCADNYIKIIEENSSIICEFGKMTALINLLKLKLKNKKPDDCRDYGMSNYINCILNLNIKNWFDFSFLERDSCNIDEVIDNIRYDDKVPIGMVLITKETTYDLLYKLFDDFD
jgi:hypothetical protein